VKIDRKVIGELATSNFGWRLEAARGFLKPEPDMLSQSFQFLFPSLRSPISCSIIDPKIP
jgi:hypothetical protein